MMQWKKYMKSLANRLLFLYLCMRFAETLWTFKFSKKMKITIINTEKSEKRYAREELDAFVSQLKDGTFTIRKGTDMELGHRLSAMGYTYHKLTQGAAYRIKEIWSTTAKQIVLVSKEVSLHLVEIVFYRPKQIVLVLWWYMTLLQKGSYNQINRYSIS